MPLKGEGIEGLSVSDLKTSFRAGLSRIIHQVVVRSAHQGGCPANLAGPSLSQFGILATALLMAHERWDGPDRHNKCVNLRGNRPI